MLGSKAEMTSLEKRTYITCCIVCIICTVCTFSYSKTLPLLGHFENAAFQRSQKNVLSNFMSKQHSCRTQIQLLIFTCNYMGKMLLFLWLLCATWSINYIMINKSIMNIVTTMEHWMCLKSTSCAVFLRTKYYYYLTSILKIFF